MNRLLQIRLAIALIGVAVWGYGVARNNSTLTLVGMALLATSLALRFVRKRRADD